MKFEKRGQRKSTKHAGTESKHALDIQHGSHTPIAHPNVEVSICAHLFLDLSGTKTLNRRNLHTECWMRTIYPALERSFRIDIHGAQNCINRN